MLIYSEMPPHTATNPLGLFTGPRKRQTPASRQERRTGPIRKLGDSTVFVKELQVKSVQKINKKVEWKWSDGETRREKEEAEEGWDLPGVSEGEEDGSASAPPTDKLHRGSAFCFAEREKGSALQ